MIPTALALKREIREWRDRRRAGPAERLAHQKELKAEISSQLPTATPGSARRIIVRDIARFDAYPQVDERLRGISPWFRVEFKGLYHGGVEVFLSVTEVTIDGDTGRELDLDEHAPSRTVFVVGRIPFDAIVGIDWEGDEYYPGPHLFCWFEQAEGPYASIELYQRCGDYDEHLEGLKFKPRRISRLRLWRGRRELRAAQREFEREVERWPE